MKTKILIWIFIIVSASIGIFYLGWAFAPGSYARAEIYEIELPEQELIEIINEVKVENQILTLPQEMKVILKDGRLGREKFDFWYHIYFYYPDKNQIVKTWTRAHTRTTTSFAFVAVNQGLTLGNWTDVNKYFLWWKNAPMKEEFEKRILSRINDKVNNKQKPNKN